MVQAQLDEVKANLANRMEVHGKDMVKPVDDWALVKIERAEEFYDLFVPNFFFGCEADDPMNAIAFDTRINPFGAQLNAVLTSDMGHWDLPDIDQMLPEAYELVGKGLLTDKDFRDFAFGNAVRLLGDMNPSFFKGLRRSSGTFDGLRNSRNAQERTRTSTGY